MNNINRPLLSICIPTFNRANILRNALYSLVPQVREFSSEVELIVSDNCSTDDTGKVVEWASQYGPIKYYKNTKNIGATKNYLSCVEKSSGEFCWILGDDDFVRFNAVEKILQIIKKYSEIDYIFVNITHITYNELRQYPQPVRGGDLPENLNSTNRQLQDFLVDKWEKLIDPIISDGYMGALQQSVFRKKVWMEYVKVLNFSEIDAAADTGLLMTLDVTFPHAKILAYGMMGKKAFYIGYPLITVVDGVRPWWDSQSVLIIGRLNELIDLYEMLGVSKDQIAKCREHTLRLCGHSVIKMLLQPTVPGEYELGFLEKFFTRFASNEVFLRSLLLSMINAYNTKVTNYRNNALKNKKVTITESLDNSPTLATSFIHPSCDVRRVERMKFGDKVVIQEGCWLDIAYNNPHGQSMIMFGEGTNIGRRCTISAANSIIFGKNVLVGPNAYISDTSHQYRDIDQPIMNQGIVTSKNSIEIKEGTWIGTNAVIIGNIVIGKGCVIGANSVVNRSIPDYCVAVGNPAKIVKAFDFNTKCWVKVDNNEQLMLILNQR